MDSTSPSQTTARIRLDYIDALRGIAAFLVLVCHCVWVDPTLQLPKFVMEALDSGKFGVQLFFVISSLTIFYSLKHSDSNTVNFFIRRFFRIAPLYFLAVAIYSLVNHSNLIGVGLNLSFLHGFSPKFINSVVPGGWSIGVEMSFYCMVPFLFKKITNLRLAINFFIISILFSFVSIYLYRKMFAAADLESFVYFWLPNQLPAFTLGIIVYFAGFEYDKIRLKEIFFSCIALCLLIMIRVVFKLPLFGDHILFGIASAAVIFLASKKPIPGLVNKVTLFLGKISYSLYLSQFGAICILQKTGFFSFIPNRTGVAPLLNTSINLLLLFATTGSLAFVLYHTIELPFQKFGRIIIKRNIFKKSQVGLRLANSVTAKSTIIPASQEQTI